LEIAMIAIAPESCCRQADNSTTEAFEAMLPTIQRVACYRFRHEPRWRRQELINDVVALAYVAYARLIKRGKVALAHPTVLALYAVRHVRDGREVGCRWNSQDVLSPLARRRRGFSVQPLNKHGISDEWEALTDDRRANPAEIACCRVDFRDWLGRLQRFKRQVALRLASGDSTSDASRHFRLSQARISQLRYELQQSWNNFQAVPAAAQRNTAGRR
jgi:hypothetical protein